VSLGSVLGFALVFVAIAWSLSAFGVAALARFGKRLSQIGPMAERRAAEVVAVVPVGIAAAIVIALGAHSALAADHCEAHFHHAHLCLTHGAAWLDRVWVTVTLAGVGGLIAMRCTLLVANAAQGMRSIRQLHAVGVHDGHLCLVESERAFCFVAGYLRPTIFVSTCAWAELDPSEQHALVAHEFAHVRHGDLRRRFVLECLLVFAAPVVAARVRATWMAAAERLCDARAADETGDPAAVASAMVSLYKLNAARPAAVFGFTPAAEHLADRVRSVLGRVPLGERAARILSWSVAIGCALLIGVAVLSAEPLHHAFETLLG
jgi:beta-lactamase regulating signal transducer with metallopeptidase domain